MSSVDRSQRKGAGNVNDFVGNDAADFVASVMSTQPIERIQTPVSSRKRNLSSDSEEDSTTKKTKTARALDTGPTPAPRKGVVCENGFYRESGSDVGDRIDRLSSDLHMLFGSLRERLDKLEAGLEQKISSKVSQMLDRRVNSEMNKIKKEVDNKVASMKADILAEVASDIENMSDRIQSITTQVPENDISLNVVIRNLPVAQNENTASRVNTMICEGLKVAEVKCVKAERKESKKQNKPGVVIARFKSYEDKRKVMEKKAALSKHRVYERVFIDHDMSRAERVMSGNFRAVLNAVRDSGLRVVGNRVVRANGMQAQNGSNNSREHRVTSERPRSRSPSGRETNASNRVSRQNRNDNGRQNRDPSDGFTTYIGRGAQRGRNGYRGRNQSRY